MATVVDVEQFVSGGEMVRRVELRFRGTADREWTAGNRGRMDYDPYVSAPLLGVAGISVVTHGRAKANMMRRAIEVAERAVANRLLQAIGEGVASAA